MIRTQNLSVDTHLKIRLHNHFNTVFFSGDHLDSHKKWSRYFFIVFLCSCRNPPHTCKMMTGGRGWEVRGRGRRSAYASINICQSNRQYIFLSIVQSRTKIGSYFWLSKISFDRIQHDQ